MMIAENQEIALATVIPLLVVVSQAINYLSTRCEAFIKARCINRISQMVVAPEEPTDEEMRNLNLIYPNTILLDALLFVAEHVYGNALYRLVLITEVCNLDYRLLHPTWRWSQNITDSLSKFARLAPMALTAENAEEYLEDEVRENRFYATATLVVARPERAIRYITRFNSLFSPYEVALLARLLRRAGAPIAYTPMLMSQNKNLQLIGIYLAEQFMAIDAEPHLQNLITSNEIDVAYAALYALCSIRGNLSTRNVAHAMKRMPPNCKASIIRHAVHSCYTPNSCSHLLDKEEQMRFIQLLNTYKSPIICN